MASACGIPEVKCQVLLHTNHQLRQNNVVADQIFTSLPVIDRPPISRPTVNTSAMLLQGGAWSTDRRQAGQLLNGTNNLRPLLANSDRSSSQCDRPLL